MNDYWKGDGSNIQQAVFTVDHRRRSECFLSNQFSGSPKLTKDYSKRESQEQGEGMKGLLPISTSGPTRQGGVLGVA